MGVDFVLEGSIVSLESAELGGKVANMGGCLLVAGNLGIQLLVEGVDSGGLFSVEGEELGEFVLNGG